MRIRTLNSKPPNLSQPSNHPVGKENPIRSTLLFRSRSINLVIYRFTHRFVISANVAKTGPSSTRFLHNHLHRSLIKMNRQSIVGLLVFRQSVDGRKEDLHNNRLSTTLFYCLIRKQGRAAAAAEEVPPQIQ